jgi:transcriptional regulator with XRE-family HTH domain
MDEMQQGISGSVRVLSAWQRESQADLGRVLGLSPVTVAQRLSGRLAWSMRDLDVLATHYRVAPAVLMAGPDQWLRSAIGDATAAA